MKRLALAPLLILAGCGSAGQSDQGAGTAMEDNHVACRIGAARQFDRFCTVEQEDSDEGRVLTIRKPDGGFRRLLVTNDGRGVVAADGAEPAAVTIIDADRIEVEIGGDTFRLPATVQAR